MQSPRDQVTTERELVEKPTPGALKPTTEVGDDEKPQKTGPTPAPTDKTTSRKNNKVSCSYPNCVIEMNRQLDKVIYYKQKTLRLDEKARKELTDRLEVSQGFAKNKQTATLQLGDVSRQADLKTRRVQVDRNTRQIVQKDNRLSYDQELIQPCACETRYHRVCIRERIVTNLYKSCPECNTPYYVGFNDCFALANQTRPNHLAYMLVQEVLFFLSVIVFSEVARRCSQVLIKVDNPWHNYCWWLLSEALCGFITIGSLAILGIRIKALYTHREIEDIVVFDKNQQNMRGEEDYNSPAILAVFFNDLIAYENQQHFYRKSVTDRFLDKQNGLLGTPLQRVRQLIANLQTTAA